MHSNLSKRLCLCICSLHAADLQLAGRPANRGRSMPGLLVRRIAFDDAQPRSCEIEAPEDSRVPDKDIGVAILMVEVVDVDKCAAAIDRSVDALGGRGEARRHVTHGGTV